MGVEDLLWGVFPYVVLTIFIGGHIYRYQKDQFGWTTKSSEFLEKKRLRLGSNLFHFGIIFVFGGHVLGLIIPASLYETLGISESTYHMVALLFGIPAGVATLLGLVLLTHRRVNIKRIKTTTSKGDWMALILLLTVVITGLIATFLNIDSAGFDYRTTIGPWLRGLFIFKVQPELMVNVPIWFKIHIYTTFALYVVWPFTRLVHVFSLPLRYLNRSYVIYKKRIPRDHVQ